MEKVKIKATAKIEEFKQWVYKHFIGVYIGIGVTVCLIFLAIGIVIGQALPSRTEQPVVYTTSVSDAAVTSQTSSGDSVELIFRSNVR